MNHAEMRTALRSLSPHALKAMAALRQYGQLILTSVPVQAWRPAKLSPIAQSWTALKNAPAYMPSSIVELSKAGLVVWEAEDRIRLARDGE
jgi:hypothetical protein